jgi:hypothetical protein
MKALIASACLLVVADCTLLATPAEADQFTTKFGTEGYWAPKQPVRTQTQDQSPPIRYQPANPEWTPTKKPAWTINRPTPPSNQTVIIVIPQQ